MPTTIYLPEQVVNILSKTVSKNPPEFKYIDKLAKYYLYLVFEQTISDFNNNSFENYTKLCSKILRKYASNYKLYFDYFKENEILESLTYIKNENYAECTKYRFSEKIRRLFETTPTKVSALEILETKLRNITWNDREINKPLDRECYHLTKWLNPNLTINHIGCTEIIEIGNYSTFNRISTTTKIANIVAGRFFATRKKETDNRLHTNFTSLCADFRPFISYEGEDLVNYDIKNSQPFFLIVIIELLKRQLEQKKSKSNYYINNKYKSNKIIYKILTTIYKSSSLMLHNLRKTLYNKEFSEEYELIKNWILNGEFYENLGNIMYPIEPSTGQWERKYKKVLGKNLQGKKIVINISDFYELDKKRKMVKDAVFVILFGSISQKGDDIKLFEQYFPAFSKLLETLKQEDQNQLALLLQQVESATIIDFVTKEIAKLHPEMPMLTVHDSIAIPRSWSTKVHMPELIKYFVKKFTGLTPRIDTDYYCPKCKAS